jgi:hypothetical protein
MSAHKWSWRHRNANNPLPAYLQPLRSTGPVLFDPTLQTAGESMATRQVLVRSEAGESARSVDRGALLRHRQGSHRHAA